jgi:hypothetical protein
MFKEGETVVNYLDEQRMSPYSLESFPGNKDEQQIEDQKPSVEEQFSISEDPTLTYESPKKNLIISCEPSYQVTASTKCSEMFLDDDSKLNRESILVNLESQPNTNEDSFTTYRAHTLQGALEENHCNSQSITSIQYPALSPNELHLILHGSPIDNVPYIYPKSQVLINSADHNYLFTPITTPTPTSFPSSAPQSPQSSSISFSQASIDKNEEKDFLTCDDSENAGMIESHSSPYLEDDSDDDDKAKRHRNKKSIESKEKKTFAFKTRNTWKSITKTLPRFFNTQYKNRLAIMRAQYGEAEVEEAESFLGNMNEKAHVVTNHKRLWKESVAVIRSNQFVNNVTEAFLNHKLAQLSGSSKRIKSDNKKYYGAIYNKILRDVQFQN